MKNPEIAALSPLDSRQHQALLADPRKALPGPLQPALLYERQTGSVPQYPHAYPDVPALRQRDPRLRRPSRYSRFRQRGWMGKKSGGIDWKKCVTVNGTQACIGVQVQISGRSELIYRDIAHFKITLVQEGQIDVGV